jgi:hypothetical protein
MPDRVPKEFIVVPLIALAVFLMLREVVKRLPEPPRSRKSALVSTPRETAQAMEFWRTRNQSRMAPEKDACAPQATNRVSSTTAPPAAAGAASGAGEAADPRVRTAADKGQPAIDRLRAIVDLNATGARVESEQDLAALCRALTDAAENETLRMEIAGLLQNHKGSGPTDALLRVLRSPDESARFRSLCVLQLWRRGCRVNGEESRQIRGALRDCLHDRDLPVRREALLALVRDNDEIGRLTAVAWLRDKAENDTHDLAIRCVRDLDLREHASLVRGFLQNTNEEIFVAAIAALGQWRDPESRATFETAASSGNPRVQRAGRTALERLDSVAKGTDSRK